MQIHKQGQGVRRQVNTELLLSTRLLKSAWCKITY